MKDKIIKGTTLTLFISLIISFVTYRSGYWGGAKSIYSVSPNGSALNKQIDSLSKRDSAKTIDLIPSSKVMILKAHPLQSKSKDSSKHTIKLDTNLKFNPLIHGSKSAIILKTDDLKKIQLDTILKDSSKKK